MQDEQATKHRSNRQRGGQRARFESIRVITPEPGRVSAEVVLEWNRERFTGKGEGETSVVGSLRASASAAMSALELALGGEGDFSLVGVKELHVFDHDLVAVLLLSQRLPERRLIGISVIGDDRHRAAALAVLNATNRAVGTLSGAFEDQRVSTDSE
ncbi:MAG: hypothetical protein WD737_03155 [Gemmatimonadota bacterium]